MDKQLCPSCSGICRLDVHTDGSSLAVLDDRIMPLGDVRCIVTCTKCGFGRNGLLKNLDVELLPPDDNGVVRGGVIRFGEITFDPV